MLSVEEIAEEIEALTWEELLDLESILEEIIQQRREKRVDERYQKYGNY